MVQDHLFIVNWAQPQPSAPHTQKRLWLGWQCAPFPFAHHLGFAQELVKPDPDWALCLRKDFSWPWALAQPKGVRLCYWAIRFPDRSSSRSSLDSEHLRADSKIHGCLASPVLPQMSQSQMTEHYVQGGAARGSTTRRAEMSAPWSQLRLWLNRNHMSKVKAAEPSCD